MNFEYNQKTLIIILSETTSHDLEVRIMKLETNNLAWNISIMVELMDFSPHCD
jgi:hypothetical protein